jgi:leucyl aminopeptidase
MIKYTLSTKSLMEHAADAYVVCVEQDADFSKELKKIATDYFPGLEQLAQKRKFVGAPVTSLVVHTHRDKKPCIIILLGIGRKGEKKAEHYRRALGHLIRLAEQHEIHSIVLDMPAASFFGLDMQELGQETGTIAPMAAYYFDTYLTEKKQKTFDITCIVAQKDKAAFQKGLDVGIIIGKSVNEARHWIDLPPEALSPIHLADMAKKYAKKYGLACTIFNEKQINAMGMGGLAGVSRGSELDAHLAILEYKTKKKNAPTLCFVGKGITFDSGGLSIKPAQAMETMKDDMSGAAAVLATMDALAQLQPHVNVIGVMPVSENLPSGSAVKPGDILKFYNGKTAEVLNTDAEGRLILADALSYAVKHYKPDAIIDIATLTGACAYALGPFFTGLMSQDAALTKKVQQAADRTGDRVWPLPLDDDYAVAIKSINADLCNIGSSKYRAGAITAAHFLKNFVDDTPWVHLDIAGTAFDVPDIPYYRTGSTGAAIRLLIDLAMHWK